MSSGGRTGVEDARTPDRNTCCRRKRGTTSYFRLPTGTNLGTPLIDAMNAIKRDFEPLLNQLPKDYDKFENDLLENLLPPATLASRTTATAWSRNRRRNGRTRPR